MISQTIDINGYWKIKVFYNVYTGEEDTGFTYTRTHDRMSVVVIGLSSSINQLLNTIVHESKHVQSAICSYYKVDEDSEDAAYLIGYIVM